MRLDEHFGIEGRVAVVTGGASGLGAAIASGLSRVGARVIVWDLQSDSAAQPTLVDQQDANCLAELRLAVDVTDRGQIEGALEQSVASVGPIDILFNSAGVTHDNGATEIPETVWDRVLAVNASGTFLCCQAVGRHMVERGGGSIINMASTLGVVSRPRKLAYSASKGAVVQLTKSLALEWAPRGVRVNALAPAAFETPMVAYAIAQDPGLLESLVAQSPQGRLGQTEDIVGPAIFLASSASAMITGHVLLVDGGYTAQ
jgi:NAD(P)-dependent dehydrogenase (short-subunit alcohol dehydrogenase family)